MVTVLCVLPLPTSIDISIFLVVLGHLASWVIGVACLIPNPHGLMLDGSLSNQYWISCETSGLHLMINVVGLLKHASNSKA